MVSIWSVVSLLPDLLPTYANGMVEIINFPNVENQNMLDRNEARQLTELKPIISVGLV